MNNEKKSAKAVTRIVTYILFASLILALLAGIMYLLNAPSGMYVVYGEENITSDNSGITIEWSAETNEVTFSIQNSDDWGAYSVQDCTVKVVPNVASKNDFEFTVDGETCLFSAETDLTAAFVEDYAAYDGNGFEITKDGEFTMHLLEFNSYNLSVAMSEYLSRVYGGSDVTLGGSVDLLSACYFALEFVSPDGGTDYVIPFTFYSNEVIYTVTLSTVYSAEELIIDPYNGGDTIGYIISDGSLTVKLVGVGEYYIYSIIVNNATVVSGSTEYGDGSYIFIGGVTSYEFTITNPTDNVISTIALYCE